MFIARCFTRYKVLPVGPICSAGGKRFQLIRHRVFDTAGTTCSSGTAATRDDQDEDASNQKSCDSSPGEGPDISSQKLFTCPEEECTKSFVRCSSLEKHCEYSAHVRALEKAALQDKAKLSYAQRLEEGQTKPLCSVTVVVVLACPFWTWAVH